MAGNQQRYTHFVKAAKDTHDFERQVRIEVPGGFIGNQELRPRHDGPRYADALLFTGGQRLGSLLLFLQQADLVERRAHASTRIAID